MPSQEKLERLAKNRTGAAKAAPKAEEERDLNSPEVQDEILHPKAVSTHIGGKEYILHPLSAKKAREFTGLLQQISVETFAGKTEAKEAYPLLSRMSGIVAQKYGDDFLPFLAVSTGEPFEVSSADAAKLAAEFSEVISYQEIALAFVHICNLNKTFESLTGSQSPKNG